jgi:hypothetical protein
MNNIQRAASFDLHPMTSLTNRRDTRVAQGYNSPISDLAVSHPSLVLPPPSTCPIFISLPKHPTQSQHANHYHIIVLYSIRVPFQPLPGWYSRTINFRLSRVRCRYHSSVIPSELSFHQCLPPSPLVSLGAESTSTEISDQVIKLHLFNL